MHRSEEECDQLVDDATQMFETFPVDAAMVFEDAGKCYDERGERTRAAQYYTLAGDMYFRCNRDKKAEKCYARAIIRNLMANDVEAAKVVLQRGSDLGFETSMFRIAAKSVQRRLEEEEIEVITPVQITDAVEITATPVSISDSGLNIPEEVQEIDLEQHVLESVQEFELSGLEEGEIVEASSTDKIMAAMAQKQRVAVQDHEIESLSTTISKEDQRVLKVTSTLIPSQATDQVLPIRDTELPESYSLTDVSVQPLSSQDTSEPGGIDLPETISVSTSYSPPSEPLTDEFHSLDITVSEKSDSIDLVIPKHLDSIKLRVPENIEKFDLLVPSDQRLKLLPQEGQDFIDLTIPKTLTRFTLLLPEKEDTLTIPIPQGLDHIDIVLTEKVENIEVWNETIGKYETISIQDPEVPLRLPVPKDKDFITVRLPEGLKKLDILVPEEIDSLRFHISSKRVPILLEVPEEVKRLGMSVSKQEYLDIAVPEDTHIVPIAIPEEMTSIDILVPQDTHSVGVISSEIIQDKTIQESRISESTTIELHPLPSQDEVEVIIPKDTQTLSVLVPEDSSKVDLFIPEDSDHLDIVVPDGLEKLKVTDVKTGSVKEIKISPDQKTVALSAPEGQQRIQIELPDEIRKLDVIVKDRSSLILPVSESTSSIRVELPEEAARISSFLPTEVKEIGFAPPTPEESIETIPPLLDESIQVEFPVSDHFIPPPGIHDTVDITPTLFLKEKPLTSSLEYISVSEVTNPYQDTVDQMETTDVIPLAWQVIRHSLEGGTLVSRKLEKKKGIAYTWKWDKIEAGQTRKVSYSLRKRLHRTVVQLKGKKIQTQSSYHSIEPGSDGTWQVSISFKSTFEETLPLVLIEDTIPPEVLIRTYSSGDFRPIILPSSDSTIFRWILKDLTPIDSFEVTYEFSDKPITMIHVRNIVDENEKELLYLERIVQPVEDTLGMAYYYYTKIQANKALVIRLEEAIPLDFEHKGTNPAWLEPKIIEQEDMKILQWKQKLNRNDELSFVMLVKGSNAFAVTFPLLTIEGYHRKDAKIERLKKREKLDLRKLISC